VGRADALQRRGLSEQAMISEDLIEQAVDPRAADQAG